MTAITTPIPVSPDPQAILDEIERLRALLRFVFGTPAESAVADQLAVELANLQAQDQELYVKAKLR